MGFEFPLIENIRVSSAFLHKVEYILGGEINVSEVFSLKFCEI